MNRLAEWMQHRDSILVMGILNVTPDSFHDGGRFPGVGDAVESALRMEADGADLIDLGGESSRPGAAPVGVQEELDRVLPVLEGLRARSDIPISIDTTKAEVARRAIAAGACMVNDITALQGDEEMAGVIAASSAFAVLMHMRGTPQTMQADPVYEDVVGEVSDFLSERREAAIQAGIRADRIWMDPGIGFGKHLEHNLELLRHIDRLAHLGSPVLIGLSRKSFIGRILDLSTDERLEGTIAANAIAVARGADVIRVHDVREGRRTADIALRLRRPDA